jgi:hypothetical protein
MDPKSRVVTRMPLRELWDSNGVLALMRQRDLSGAALREILRGGPREFVVANVGEPLRWIPREECFDFWKDSAKSHIAESERFDLDEFPDGLAYFASSWSDGFGRVVILLEAHH